MLGQLGLQRRLDDPPGQLGDQPARAGDLPGLKAPDASSSAPSGNNSASRSTPPSAPRRRPAAARACDPRTASSTTARPRSCRSWCPLWPPGRSVTPTTHTSSDRPASCLCRSRRRCARRSSHRRQLVLAPEPLRQRLHDQLNALAPGLSAPEGHGRALLLHTPTGRAVLACAIDFEGRAPSPRSLQARAGGRLTDATAGFWSGAGRTASRRPPTRRCERLVWRAMSLASGRCARTSRSSTRKLEALLADSAGQVLTRCPVSRPSAPPRSPPTRCRSRAFRHPSTCTPRPAWHRPAMSPRPSANAPRSAAPACPSTATR